MEQLPGLPQAAFDKLDPAPDALFYAHPRFVTHIDDQAIATITQVYRDRLPAGGDVLDLMSSWVSHLPPDVEYARVVGHGMNEKELTRNPRLTRWFVQDLNQQPLLPLPAQCFDAACLCVSVQYLQRPTDIFREVVRVLRPGSPFIVSFSNRCFSTKAVAIWRMLSGLEQQRLVAAVMQAAGFGPVALRSFEPELGDPVWFVIGTAPPAGAATRAQLT